MLSPFNLKRYLSADSNADPEDVLNVKTALKQFGHYKTPKYGMTQYPDQPMFDGVKKYQSENGLR